MLELFGRQIDVASIKWSEVKAILRHRASSASSGEAWREIASTN